MDDSVPPEKQFDFELDADALAIIFSNPPDNEQNIIDLHIKDACLKLAQVIESSPKDISMMVRGVVGLLLQGRPKDSLEVATEFSKTVKKELTTRPDITKQLQKMLEERKLNKDSDPVFLRFPTERFSNTPQ